MSDSLFADAHRFFSELEVANTPEWWAQNRHRYEISVHPPFAAVLAALGGQWRTYRPRNDTRFAAGRPPYKTFIGAVSERTDGIGAFVRVDAHRVLVGTGMPMFARDQLSTFRAAAVGPRSEGLLLAVERVRTAGADVHGGRWEPLKRTPRGIDPGHPTAEFTRWKGVEITTRTPHPAWPTVEVATSSIRAFIERGEPVHAWLASEVGPSTMTPEERFAPRPR